MEILTHLLLGLATALTWHNLLWCLAGVTLGTLVGVLPGLGTMAALSILLPMTYTIGDPATSIIFLAGIYYGTQYGGSTTAILLNLPGEASSVVTTLDGYQMTRQGRGGVALAIAALSSFLAGTVATALIMLVSRPLAEVAFLFGAAEFASLMLLGLLASVALIQGSFLKGLGMVCIGILLGSIGTDINTGTNRFDLAIPELMDGISFGIVAMGVFGLAEVLYNVLHVPKTVIGRFPIGPLYPKRQDLADSAAPALRGTVIGSILGLLPGGGAMISSFASYALEKKLSRNPDRFGKGELAGVAAPEAANNAGAQTSFIPMLSIGLPTTPVMALMIAALMIAGIQPGPQVMTNNASLFWGLIVSMWVGNLFLLVLNYPLISIWVSVLKISWKILYPMILIICVIGAWYINNSWFDVWMLIPMTIFGYALKLLDCEPAPLAMGFVIGDMFEENLRRALQISRGDWTIFIDKPWSLALLVTAAVLVVGSIWVKRKIKDEDRATLDNSL